MQIKLHLLRLGYLLTSLLVLTIGLAVQNSAYAGTGGTGRCDVSTLTNAQRGKIQVAKQLCEMESGQAFKLNADCSYSCTGANRKCIHSFIGETRHTTYECKGVSLYISGTGSTIGVMTLLQKFDNSVNSMNTQVIRLQRKAKGKSCPNCSKLFAQATRLKQRAKGKLSAGQVSKIVPQMDRLRERMQRQAKELNKLGTIQPRAMKKSRQTQKQKGATITKPAHPGAPMPTKPIPPGTPMAK